MNSVGDTRTAMLGDARRVAAELAACIPDGSSLCLAPDYSGCSLTVVRELVRQRRRNLHLIGAPQMGLQADILIGAGCVASVDAAAVTLGEFGQAPCFVRACLTQSLRMYDSTCPVIHAGLQAAEKGLPFMPVAGILGSDLVRHRDDWRVIDNPYHVDTTSPVDTTDPVDPTGSVGTRHQAGRRASPARILLVPAIHPDVALFHVALADRHGNVFIGVRREMMSMAHAARTTLVSAEQIVDEDLLADEQRAAGVISSLYITRVVPLANGAAPTGLAGHYPPDADVIAGYAKAAKTAAGFDTWLREWLGE